MALMLMNLKLKKIGLRSLWFAVFCLSMKQNFSLLRSSVGVQEEIEGILLLVVEDSLIVDQNEIKVHNLR